MRISDVFNKKKTTEINGVFLQDFYSLYFCIHQFAVPEFVV